MTRRVQLREAIRLCVSLSVAAEQNYAADFLSYLLLENQYSPPRPESYFVRAESAELIRTKLRQLMGKESM